MIDPLLRPPRGERELVDDWSEDPWDDPRRLNEAGGVSTDIAEPISLERYRDVLRLAAVVVVALTLLFGVVGWWYLRQVNPSGEATATATFTINQGDSLSEVSKRLEDQGFISSAGVFRWYVARNGGIELEPGFYSLRAKAHMGDIMAILNTPPSITYSKVTFPEGFTIAQIARRLEDKTIRITEADVLAAVSDPAIVANFKPDGVDSLEGLLFPDTYLVSGDETPTQVIQRMVTLMEDVAREEGLADSQSKVGFSPYKVLIVASMIEREAKVEEDRAKIARVIYNRLEAGMPLQIDATLYYGAPEGASFADLKAVEGPYNTYLKKGLPPTPIASPGRASIRAALNPTNNPPASDPLCAQTPKPCRYLYYVLADADGRHVFAATLAQHEANVEAARAAGLLP